MDAIKDCSKSGDLVLDPFGGSGTTLIAAEKTRRHARVSELDPAYVDLTIRRWEKFTGREAVHIVNGKTFFAETAAERAPASASPPIDASDEEASHGEEMELQGRLRETAPTQPLSEGEVRQPQRSIEEYRR